MSSANRRLTRSYAVADLSKPEPPATEQPRPVPKKRRQPPKSATTAATSAITPPEAEVAERECPLSGHAVETNKDDQPPVKKSKVANSEADIRSPSSPVTPQPGKQNRPKPVLRTLPDRKRNPHPGAIVMNHPRRTSAQVAADKKRAEELKQSLEELAQKKVEILAEIEVQQQMDDAEEERRVVKRLEDLGVSAEEFSDHSGDTEVDEGVAKLDSGDSSGEDTDQTRATPLKVTRKKKPGRGETRAAVDAAKDAIKGKKRKLSVDSDKTSTSKVSKTTAFPSGLVSNWKQKAASHKPAKATAPAGSSVEQKLGGLDDEDAHAVQPARELSPSAESRNDGRKNDLVLMVTSSESDSDEVNYTSRNLKTKSQSGPEPISRVASAGSTACTATSESKSIGPSKGKALASLTKVKSESPGTLTENISYAPTFETDGLPDFVRAGWSTSFLPTLYCYLSAAPNPWELYKKGANLVNTIQEILDTVYPRSAYKVKLGDKIFTMSRDRLNEKRTYFGREATKLVKGFFDGDKYASNRRAISKYARWATRGDGPSIYGKPTPIDCVTGPDYIEPKEPFESRLIILLVAPFLKWCKNSCKDYGRPVGAFAMAATAVERAFKMYHSGERVDVSQFSREKVGEMIDDYVVSLSKFSDRRWTKILDICGAHSNSSEDESPSPSTQSMQNKRRTLYIPSSPTNED